MPPLLRLVRLLKLMGAKPTLAAKLVIEDSMLVALVTRTSV